MDVVITGADRVTKNGDACNKIGTYLKASPGGSGTARDFCCFLLSFEGMKFENKTRDLSDISAGLMTL